MLQRLGMVPLGLIPQLHSSNQNRTLSSMHAAPERPPLTVNVWVHAESDLFGILRIHYQPSIDEASCTCKLDLSPPMPCRPSGNEVNYVVQGFIQRGTQLWDFLPSPGN
jgi:hypothetical protein